MARIMDGLSFQTNLSIKENRLFKVGLLMRALIFLALLFYQIDLTHNQDYLLYTSSFNILNKLSIVFIYAVCEVFILNLLFSFNRINREEILRYYWASPLILFFILFDSLSFYLFSFSCLYSFYLIRFDKLKTFSLAFPFLCVFNPLLILATPIYFTVLYANRSFSPLKILIAILASSFIFSILFVLDIVFFDSILLINNLRESLYLGFNFGEIKIYLVILFILLSCYFIYSRFRVGILSLISLVGILTFLQSNLSGSFTSLSAVAIFISFIMIAVENKNRYLYVILSILIPIYTIFNLSFNQLDLNITLANTSVSLIPIFDATIDTFLFTSLIYFNLFILGSTIINDDKFKFSKKPFFIAIAGDSSSGKTTLVDNMASFFGYGSTLKISGDDYHKYERENEIWKTNTHLNPRMNYLDKLTLDIKKLMKHKKAFSRSYNHSTGKFSLERILNSSEIIFVEGLHSLYLNDINRHFDLKIFLSMDESLRLDLKIKRDSIKRGKTEDEVIDSLKFRMPDAISYIHPQEYNSDIAFKFFHSGGKKVNMLLTIRRLMIDLNKLESILHFLNLDCHEVIDSNRGDVYQYKIEGSLGPIPFYKLKNIFRFEEIELLSQETSKIDSGNEGLTSIIILLAFEGAIYER